MENVREIPFETIKGVMILLASTGRHDTDLIDMIVMASAGELVPVGLISRVIEKYPGTLVAAELGDILDAEI